ncbi:MAG: LysE family transporter, partial [Deinococcus sp.]|nr:LysE family transporter [Deinococcus sp.]
FSRAVALGFAVAAPLGPTGTTAVRQGLTSGALVTFWIGMGAAFTDLFYILATYWGITPLLFRLPWLTPLLYGLGALMLGRMGLGAVRQAARGGRSFSAPTPGGNLPALSGWRAPLLLGISVTVVNPATITSWLSIGGAFIAAHLLTLSPLQAVGVMLGILVGSAAWFSILALLVGVARASLGRLPWLFRAAGLLSGLALLGFALAFAWKGIQLIL